MPTIDVSPKRNLNGYIVSVSEVAFIETILSAYEAYTVNHITPIQGNANRYMRRKEVETHGSLFGNFSTGPNGETLCTINFVSADTSAVQGQGGVEPNLECMDMKHSFVQECWPYYKRVGSFHTHPYSTDERNDVTIDGLYDLSHDDREYIRINSRKLSGFGNYIEIVVAVTEYINKLNRVAVQACSNTVRYDYGKFRFWMSAYCCFEENGTLRATDLKDTSVHLVCPAALGQTMIF
ncbi:hypothetical protein [Fundidesulfovibrio soli]|uniref:hypothetical protein n=1 Tax=Fundidesulfovibrio soli TaxID=2922716 RepID=UPI001FB01C56|nr:hypothetical protein [Fundidesulfovibrio soli]